MTEEWLKLVKANIENSVIAENERVMYVSLWDKGKIVDWLPLVVPKEKRK